MSADRFKQAAKASDSGSWNKYSYVLGDPINGYDPAGLDCQLASYGGTAFVLSCGFAMTPDQTGGGGSSDDRGTNSPNSAYGPYNAQDAAVALRGFVKNKDLTDCQALGVFADFASSQEGIDSFFVQDFGVFFSNTDPSVQKAQSVGIPISGSNDPITLGNGTSGFSVLYQEMLAVGADQAHHFAAFFELGYFAGALAGDAVARYLDGTSLTNFNGGDIALGIYASKLGADLKSGNLKASQVGSKIRTELCAHN